MWKIFENELLQKIKFSPAVHRDGSRAPDLVDVILQHDITGGVLFGASMDQETFRETLTCKNVVLYSKSRKCRWYKGKTSGDILQVKRIFLNCERDHFLIYVIPLGQGVCHEKDEKGVTKPTCFSTILCEL